MGTYVWYSGAADYPLEKRKRIKENILKILDAGGMMQIGTIKITIMNYMFYLSRKKIRIIEYCGILTTLKMICGKLQVWIAKTYRFILIK